MIGDEELAGILEDPQRMDDAAWTACIGELHRDADARAEVRALLRQDERIAQALGRIRPTVQAPAPPARRRSPPRPAKPALLLWAVAAAAVIALAVTIWTLGGTRTPGVILVQGASERPVLPGERIAPGAPATLRWQDGSTVTLSAAAIARVESPDLLRLDAGFCRAEVTPDPSRRLSIATAQAEVSVLGTAFTVSCLPSATAVSVERGRVRVGGGGGQVSLDAGCATRIDAGQRPEPPRRRWPAFDPGAIVAGRGGLLTNNATVADGPDGPELASAFQYRESGITGVRLLPAAAVPAVAGLRIQLRYRAIKPTGRVSLQCRNATQEQNFMTALPEPPADGSWIEADIELATLTPITRKTPWQPGEGIGNVLLVPEGAQTSENIIRLGDFAFTAPLEP